MQFTNEKGKSGEAYVIVPGDKYAQISETLKEIGKKYGGIVMPATSFNQAEPHLDDGKYVAAVRRGNGDVFDVYAFDSPHPLRELKEALNKIGFNPEQYVLTITTPRKRNGEYSGIDNRTVEMARKGTRMDDLYNSVNEVLSQAPGTYAGIREVREEDFEIKRADGLHAGTYVQETSIYSVRKIL